MSAKRPDIDIAEVNQALRLVLSEFACYSEYTTADKRLPLRTDLCEIDELWWQSAIDDVLADFERTWDRDSLRRDVETFIEMAKRLLARDVRVGNRLSIKKSGFFSRGAVIKGAGDIAVSKHRLGVNDHGSTSFTGNVRTSAPRKSKAKETVSLPKEMDKDFEDNEDSYYHNHDSDDHGYFPSNPNDNNDNRRYFLGNAEDDDDDGDDADDNLPQDKGREYVSAGDDRGSGAHRVDLTNIATASPQTLSPCATAAANALSKSRSKTPAVLPHPSLL